VQPPFGKGCMGGFSNTTSLLGLMKHKKGSANFDPAHDFYNSDDYFELELRSTPLILILRRLSETIV